MRYFFIYIMAILCALFFSIKGQAQQFPFFNLNVENGLIQSQVQGGLAQDKAGNLWMATIGGVSKYDGNTITNYTVRDGLPENNINAITADKNGDIWLGHSGGVTHVEEHGFRYYPFPELETSKQSAVTQIKANEQGLWCLAGGQLWQVQNGKMHQIMLPTSSAITALLPLQNDMMLAAKNGIIYQRHHDVWDSIHMQLPPQSLVLKMYQDKKKRIWLATTTGIYLWKNNKAQPFTPGGAAIKIPTTAITEDANGNLWASTVSGVLQFTDSTVLLYNKHNGLFDNTFLDVLTDKEGNVWMASDGKGVFRYSGAAFSTLDERSGLQSAQVMSMAYDPSGKLYLGTFESGLYCYEKGSVKKIALPDNYSAIMTMEFDGQTLWMGVAGEGLVGYDGQRFTTFNSKNSKLKSKVVTALFYDDQQRLWVGSLNGLWYKKGKEMVELPLNNEVINHIYPIGNDSILIATNNGLKLYHQQRLHNFITHTVVDSSVVQCYIKKQEELWLGTNDNGVICYNLKTQKAYVINKANGLQSDFIYNIIQDHEGNIWLGTGYGIYQLSFVKKGLPKIKFYGSEQGVTGMESNHNAVLRLPDNSLWFGTTNGAVHYVPGNRNVAPAPVSVALQSVQLFGANIIKKQYFDSVDYWSKIPFGLRLPYAMNNLSFTFRAVSLAAEDRLLYRYRIQGMNENWSEWSDVNSVTYPALPAGKFVLQVQSKAWENDSVVRSLNYPFEIITPFHQTNWFRLLVLGACILLGVVLQYMANKRKINRQKLLQTLRKEEQEKVRLRTAEDFHDEVGNKLTRINILTTVLKNKLGHAAPEADRIIEQIQDNTGQLYSGTRDILWSLNPSNDNLMEILHRIRDFGFELFQYTDIEFDFQETDERWSGYKLPMDVSRNLIMICKEALNNCLKYAKATKVTCVVNLLPNNRIEIKLRDNGKGFNQEKITKGHGLENMRLRAERIKGHLAFISKPGEGTLIQLNFHLLPDIPLKRG